MSFLEKVISGGVVGDKAGKGALVIQQTFNAYYRLFSVLVSGDRKKQQQVFPSESLERKVK